MITNMQTSAEAEDLNPPGQAIVLQINMTGTNMINVMRTEDGETLGCLFNREEFLKFADDVQRVAAVLR